MTGTIQFLREALAELRKATWLTRKEAIGSTVAITALVGLIAAYVASLDFVLSIIFGSLLGR